MFKQNKDLGFFPGTTTEADPVPPDSLKTLLPVPTISHNDLHKVGKCPLEISVRLLTSLPLVTQTWTDPTLSRSERPAYCINPKKERHFSCGLLPLQASLTNMQPLFLVLAKVSHKSGLLSYFSETGSSHFSMFPRISSIPLCAAGSQLEVKIFLFNLSKTVQHYQCITPPTTF